MTQKKIPTVISVDDLIKADNVSAIIAEYVRLSLEVGKLAEYIRSKPEVMKAITPLLSARGALLEPSNNSIVSNNIPIPSGMEPLGTVHTNAPPTYDYPMDAYSTTAMDPMDEYSVKAMDQSQSTVKTMLQAYQGIDPTGAVV